MKRFIIILLVAFILFAGFSSSTNAQIQRDVVVTATVEPDSNDAFVLLTANIPEGSYLARGEEVVFTIEFNVEPESGFPMVLVASWEEGEIVGSPGNFVEAYDYAIGSATPAPDASLPIVDLLNRTITWNIANVSQSPSPYEVSFALRAKQSFLTNDIIEVYTNVNASYGGAVIAPDNYQLFIDPTLDEITPTPSFTPTPTNTITPTPSATYTPAPTFTPSPTVTPSPTYTPTPTSTLTPQPTATPTHTPRPSTPTPTAGPTATHTPAPTTPPTLTPSPQPVPIPVKEVEFEFEKVDILNISDSTVTVATTLSLNSTLRIPFGVCSSEDFEEVVVIDESEQFHEIVFENLLPDTQYCFRIDATNSLLQTTISSDIFTFKTAAEGQSYVIGSVRTLWNSLQLNGTESQNLLVPAGVPVVMNIMIENPETIAQLDGEFVHRSVLGVSTLARTNVQQVRFIEVGKGQFAAEIQTPQLPGNYAFTLRIRDKVGNYSKRLIPYSIVVSPFLKVTDENGSPVENAYVTIQRQEESTGEFVSFNTAFTLSQAEQTYFLPYATDTRGYLRIALPVGVYQAQIDAVGYAPQEYTFRVDDGSTEFPTITLTPSFSLQSLLKYINMTVSMGYERFIFDANQYFSTRILLTLSHVVQLVMIIGVVVFGLLKVGVIDRIHSKVAVMLHDLEEELFELFLGSWTLANIGLSIAFIIFQGFVSALPMLIVTILLIMANIVLFFWKEKYILHKVQ